MMERLGGKGGGGDDPVLRNLAERLRATPLAELRETAARLRPEFLSNAGEAASSPPA